MGALASVTITDEQQFPISGVTGEDAAGNSVPLTGTATYSVSDPTILTLLTDPADLAANVPPLPAGSAIIQATGPLGTATVSISDSGMAGASATIPVVVDASAEVSLAAVVGPPVAKVASVATTPVLPVITAPVITPIIPTTPVAPVTPVVPGAAVP